MLSFFFFFKQKTAYEMRISDWSSDVCSSDLAPYIPVPAFVPPAPSAPVAPPAAGSLYNGPINGYIVHHHVCHRTCCICNWRPISGSGGQIGRASCRERVCQYV